MKAARKEAAEQLLARFSSTKKKFGRRKVTGKFMLTVFWDSEGVVHKEYLKKGDYREFGQEHRDIKNAEKTFDPCPIASSNV